MFNFKQIISSIADAGEKLFKRKVIKKNDLETILSLCDDLISNKGAAFGIAVARDITNLYLTLSDENKLLFFKKINEKYKPSFTKVNDAIEAYQKTQNEKNTDEKILHLSFHRIQTDSQIRFVVYVAKDHHQNTYCNTPKNEY